MEQRPRAHYDEFADQFTFLLHENWSDILQVINRQSPRVATLLRVAIPTGMQRINGTWRIQLMARRVAQRDKLQQPRDNEVVAQAIRSWANTSARLKLPDVIVDFEL